MSAFPLKADIRQTSTDCIKWSNTQGKVMLNLKDLFFIIVMGFILSGCVTKLDQVIPSDAKRFDVKKPSYRVEWLSEDSIKVSVWTTNLDSGAARFIASDAAKMRDFKYITEQDGYDEVCIDYCGRFLETSLTFILSQKALNSSSLKADLTLNTLSKKYSKS